MKYTNTEVVIEGIAFNLMDKPLEVVAKELKMPRSTLLHHLTVRLPLIDKRIANTAQKILKKHKHERNYKHEK